MTYFLMMLVRQQLTIKNQTRHNFQAMMGQAAAPHQSVGHSVLVACNKINVLVLRLLLSPETSSLGLIT